MESSSDSSSSDDNENLKEALDTSMFTSTKCVTNSENNHSIRHRKSVDFNYKSNILCVTPEFQNFVAKRLSEMLDKTIKEFHNDNDVLIKPASGGIKLFTNSKKLLKDKRFKEPFSCDNSMTDSQVKVKKRKQNVASLTRNDSDEESERITNAESVAVSPSWVLEKKGTVGWSKPKGDAFIYRKNENNVLEIVNKPE